MKLFRTMMKLIFMILLTAALSAQQFNINTATSEQLGTLPLTPDQIDDLENYLQRRNELSNIYELLNVESITSSDINQLKPLVFVSIPEISDFIAGQKTSSYKVEQWLSTEGNTEGLSEVWLDRFFDPRDINTMNYDDLNSLPNLSPVDVVAVMKQKKRGPIYGTFELKNSPGISYWGYKNLRDFVRFRTDSLAKPQLHMRFNQLVRTVPVTTNPDDEGQITAFSDASRPELFRKLSITYGDHWKSGYTYHQNMGNSQGIFNEKTFISVENISLGASLRLDRLVVGNFTTSFGQGVVMETSDYFSPRRTGYRFTKRAEGIYPDLTRSSQYVMEGVALQISNDYFRGAAFLSRHPRDAIINADSSFSSLIVMQPRLRWGANGDTTKIFQELTSSVDEVTWGGNIRFTPITGFHIGFTFYESLYDRVLDPKPIETILGSVDDLEPEFDELTDYDDYSGDAFYLQYMTNSSDPEIAAMYASEGESNLWSGAKSFRRIIGIDFTAVIGNMAFQGEYGEFSGTNYRNRIGDEPHALVLSAYTQFDNFNFLALYRNYDLEFDNPYQRSFSNYQRYKTSIFEDSYWLEDPVYSYLYSGNPQPQAEEGVFVSSRYQFHRSFVGTLNWDTWTRKADEARYFRTVATIDWRPVFNYRINIRQKWQARGAFDIQHPSPFDSRETRIRVRLRLSKYDQAELLFVNGYTTFSPRPRLTGNAESGYSMTVGSINTPDKALGISFVHNFNDHLKVRGGSVLFQGFIWYFEDTDFRIFNTEAGSLHNWLAFNFRPTNQLAIRFKLSHTIDYPMSRITEGKLDSGEWVSNPLVNKETSDFRIQVDYAL